MTSVSFWTHDGKSLGSFYETNFIPSVGELVYLDMGFPSSVDSEEYRHLEQTYKRCIVTARTFSFRNLGVRGRDRTAFYGVELYVRPLTDKERDKYYADAGIDVTRT